MCRGHGHSIRASPAPTKCGDGIKRAAGGIHGMSCLRLQTLHACSFLLSDQRSKLTLQQACVNLYSSLTWRFTRSAPFLYRTLRRDIPRTKSVEPQVLPTIRYVAADDGVTWSRKVSKMRCLWCARRFYRFTNEKELMLHLQTCHGRFKYEIEKKRPPAPKSPPENIVYVRIVIPFAWFSVSRLYRY